MKKSFVCVAALALSAAGTSFAGIIDNDPANDVQSGADTVTLVNGSATFNANLISGQTGDVDWFTFDAPANSVIVIAIIPLDIPLQSPNTILGLFDAGGNMLAFNDDGGFPSNLGSFIAFETTGADTFWFAVSGFGDDANFDGSHTQTGLYAVKISAVLIPTPGAIALVGLAGFAATRRRR